MIATTVPSNFLQNYSNPFDSVNWITSDIITGSGKIIHNVEFPDFWSENAKIQVAEKYFRRTDVPQFPQGIYDRHEAERQGVDWKILPTGPEKSLRYAVNRIAGCITYWGTQLGYFTSTAHSEEFFTKLVYDMVHQYASFNSPQWFNTGIHWAYGIEGDAKGQWYYDFNDKTAKLSTNSFEHPQAHACLPYRALVNTPSGVIPIGDIVSKNLVGLEVFDKTGTTKVLAVKSNGIRRVFKVVLNNGNYIETTDDHLVWASDNRHNRFRWIHAGELRSGMYVKQRTNTYIEDQEETGQNISEAVLAGWLQSDGFVGQYGQGTNKSLIVEFITVNDQEFEYITRHLAIVFPDKDFNEIPVESKTPGLRIRRLRAYGEYFRNFVSKYNLTERGAGMRIPDAIMRGSKSQICSYLRSIFQAEGWVSNRIRSHHVGFGMISSDLVRDAQHLLNSLGIYSIVRTQKDKRSNRQDFITLHISTKPSRLKFEEIIGFIGEDKQFKLQKSIAENIAGKNIQDSKSQPVSHIEFASEEEVFDIQTESGSFLHNNIVVHNCFILGVKDDLFGPNGIFDTAKREAKIFYFGSGSGSNYSTLRGKGEPVSGGGISSGMMSFLDIYDVGGGAIKSGGKTRRAAKMDICNDTHPELIEFIQWKMRQEKMVRILIEAGMSAGFEDEAYRTVRGMNSNNTIAFSHDFFSALKNNDDWYLRWVTDPSHVSKTIPARDVWNEVVYATWFSADPGIHATDTINEWHTCKEDGRILSSNPCVTGDTFVATSDGYRRIKDIVGTRQNIINGNGDIVPVSKIFKTGTKDIYRIRTKSGYSVRVTGDHKIWTTNRGDVPASELRPTDSVQLRGAGFGSVSLSEDAATVLGAVVGDGCVTQGSMVITSGKDERLVSERFVRSLNALKNEDDAHYGYSVRESHVSESATALRVSTSSVGVIEYLSQYAVMDEGSDRKRFTDAFFATDHLTQRAALRALYTADGTVANYGDKSQYISLDSTSVELLQQVQLLLLNFGIKSKLYENRRPEGQTSSMLPDGRGGMKEYDVKQMHSLRVSRSSRVTFEREIGFLPESKKSAILEHVNKSFGVYGDNMEDRIFSITPDGTEDVYDLTEPVSNHFVANGMVVHNCSEYLFLDETACNLASINLAKFYDIDHGKFDTESFRDRIRSWQIALDITISMAQYPEKDICEKSIQYRTTGLGFSNLGGLLMLMGYGYADAHGQQVAGAITAIMGGEAYATSALLASRLGEYPAYQRNEESHLRVIRNHRRAAFGQDDYELVTKKPKGLRDDIFPQEFHYLLSEARQSWDDALLLGELYGYRNAQTTVLAPTGTISFAMDCDTFGIEPDYALVKYKALAGGGYAVIVNRLIDPALKRLGYTESQRQEICDYVNQHGSVVNSPHLHDRHYHIFDTAVAAGEFGRCLSAESHIEMMAACQPFLSGAISKTINLPESATQDDISGAYLYGYELGLKAIAVFRANSKAASVMFTKASDLTTRQTIDLGSKKFDIDEIFNKHFPYYSQMKHEEDAYVEILEDDSENSLAIEMPTYGCKDGVCSI